MAGLLWPKVFDALAALLPTLPLWSDVAIYQATPVTDESADKYVTLGWIDNEEAGTYQRGRAPSGMEMLEEGDIRSALTCQSGGTDDLPVLRDEAFGLLADLESAVEADRTLGGVLPPQSEVTLAGVVDLIQNANGAAVRLTFALHYYAIQ